MKKVRPIDATALVICLENDIFGLNCFYEYKGYVKGVKSSIEFVKNMPTLKKIDSNNEFCDWTIYDYEKVKDSHGGIWSMLFAKDFRHCPFCGKKIIMVSRD